MVAIPAERKVGLGLKISRKKIWPWFKYLYRERLALVEKNPERKILKISRTKGWLG